MYKLVFMCVGMQLGVYGVISPLLCGLAVSATYPLGMHSAFSRKLHSDHCDLHLWNAGTSLTKPRRLMFITQLCYSL